LRHIANRPNSIKSLGSEVKSVCSRLNLDSLFELVSSGKGTTNLFGDEENHVQALYIDGMRDALVKRKTREISAYAEFLGRGGILPSELQGLARYVLADAKQSMLVHADEAFSKFPEGQGGYDIKRAHALQAIDQMKLVLAVQKLSDAPARAEIGEDVLTGMDASVINELRDLGAGRNRTGYLKY
jgi:hypothetical protein